MPHRRKLNQMKVGSLRPPSRTCSLFERVFPVRVENLTIKKAIRLECDLPGGGSYWGRQENRPLHFCRCARQIAARTRQMLAVQIRPDNLFDLRIRQGNPAMNPSQPFRDPFRLTAPRKRGRTVVELKEPLDLPVIAPTGHGQMPRQRPINELRRNIQIGFARQQISSSGMHGGVSEPTARLPYGTH